ncbi:MAG: hypothetical protein IJ064_05590 [Bacteroidaceae bacterium]|nr:hypothetical protein [Bacteroidaceae bacterium]
MKSLRIETSVRDARKANEALSDTGLRDQFNQTSSNVWELQEYNEDEMGEYLGDEYAEEQLDDFAEEIKSVFSQYGVTEFEIEII